MSNDTTIFDPGRIKQNTFHLKISTTLGLGSFTSFLSSSNISHLTLETSQKLELTPSIFLTNIMNLVSDHVVLGSYTLVNPSCGPPSTVGGLVRMSTGVQHLVCATHLPSVRLHMDLYKDTYPFTYMCGLQNANYSHTYNLVVRTVVERSRFSHRNVIREMFGKTGIPQLYHLIELFDQALTCVDLSNDPCHLTLRLLRITDGRVSTVSTQTTKELAFVEVKIHGRPIVSLSTTVETTGLHVSTVPTAQFGLRRGIHRVRSENLNDIQDPATCDLV